MTQFDRAVLKSLSLVPGSGYTGPVYPEEPTGPIDFVLVGEAPGKTEVKMKKPFCGASGTLLREVVKQVGLARVHYTNASYYRPPVRGSKDTKPTQKILAAERPRLMLEIAVLKPKGVVALGATAAYALCGQVPRSRGMVQEFYYLGHACPIWITRHPAAVFYNPDYYLDLVTDLERAAKNETPRQILFGIERNNETGIYQLLRPNEPVNFLGETIYIDTEATSSHFPSASLICVAITDSTATHLFKNDPHSLECLRESLREYRGQIVGQNTQGDEILLRRAGIPIRFTGDTLLRHYSQDERKGSHGLKVLAPTLGRCNTHIDRIWPYIHTSGVGGDDAGDSEDERTGTWASIPMETLEQYCAADSLATLRVDSALKERGDSRSEQVYGFLRRSLRAFTEGMARGIRVDTPRLYEELVYQDDKVRALRGDFDFDPEKRKEVLEALNAAGYKTTSTTKERLKALGLGNGLPTRLLEYRKEAKLLQGFLRPLAGWTDERGIAHPGWVGADGIVHPSYRLFGTESGRTSCREPNVQQIPQRLKSLFIPRDGHVFIGWDMKQHEVRGIAYLSQDVSLCNLLRDPSTDPHAVVGQAAGVDRGTGKRSLFATAYGASIDKLVSTGIPRESAIHATETVQRMFPSLSTWKEEIVRRIWEDGYLETPHYRRRRHFWYINRRTRGHQERVGVNFLPQSLGADICMDGATAVFERLGLPPLIFVHDFNLVEVPEDESTRLAGACHDIAASVFPNPLVDFLPEVKIGASWGELHLPEEEINEEGEEDAIS